MKAHSKGFSLLELTIVATLFALFLLISYGLLQSGIHTWHKTESSQDVHFQFQKLRHALHRDLRDASTGSCAVMESDGSTTSDKGEALWFLSASSPESGLARKRDSTPFWQRNVLYYLTTSTDHDHQFGMQCGDGPFACPHRMLIRRVFDSHVLTTPDGALETIETLMSATSIQEKLLAPTGYTLGTRDAEVESQEILASGLLQFEVQLQPEGRTDEIEIRVAGFDVEHAGKVISRQTESLEHSPYTHFFTMSVFPANSGL